MVYRRKKILICSLFLPVGFTFAQVDSWGGYGTTPSEVLDSVVGKSNQTMKFQETAIDGITNTQGGYEEEFQISNTLDWLRINVAPYLQWAVYIGLSMAVILLIYNGFLMVTHAVHNSGDFTAIKKRIIYIGVGVIVLTSFYAILKLVVGLINSIFGTNTSGDTGF